MLYMRPALVPGDRRVLPQPRRRAVGRPPAHARARSPPSWASTPRDLADLADGAGRPARRAAPGCCAASTRRSTRPCCPTTPTAGTRDRELAATLSELRAGQGRVGDRPAAGRDRRHRARLRGRRPGAAGRPRRSPSGCSRASSGCAPATTATTSATARSSAPARTRRSCTGSATTARTAPGRAAADGHGRGGPQPLHRRRHPDAAGLRHVHRRCSARSTTSCTRSQQAGIDAIQPGREVRRRAPDLHAGARRGPGRPGPAAGQRGRGDGQGVAWSTAGGPCTASATCSASTCTTAPHARKETYRDGDARRGLRAHRRAGPVLPARGRAGARPSCAASASASRTTCWSPRTARVNLSAGPAPHRRRGRGVARRPARGRPPPARLTPR